jgi:hypothetical protein
MELRAYCWFVPFLLLVCAIGITTKQVKRLPANARLLYPLDYKPCGRDNLVTKQPLGTFHTLLNEYVAIESTSCCSCCCLRRTIRHMNACGLYCYV